MLLRQNCTSHPAEKSSNNTYTNQRRLKSIWQKFTTAQHGIDHIWWLPSSTPSPAQWTQTRLPCLPYHTAAPRRTMYPMQFLSTPPYLRITPNLIYAHTTPKPPATRTG